MCSHNVVSQSEDGNGLTKIMKQNWKLKIPNLTMMLRQSINLDGHDANSDFIRLLKCGMSDYVSWRNYWGTTNTTRWLGAEYQVDTYLWIPASSSLWVPLVRLTCKQRKKDSAWKEWEKDAAGYSYHIFLRPAPLFMCEIHTCKERRGNCPLRLRKRSMDFVSKMESAYYVEVWIEWWVS